MSRLLLLLAAASAWTALVLAAPMAPPALAAPVYAAASVVCHQLPERSFAFAAGPLAVCARCLGLYAGGVGGFALAAALRPGGERLAGPRTIVAAAAVPTLLTLVAEWTAAWPVGNSGRFAAALPLGAALAIIIGAAVTADARRCDRLKT